MAVAVAVAVAELVAVAVLEQPMAAEGEREGRVEARELVFVAVEALDRLAPLIGLPAELVAVAVAVGAVVLLEQPNRRSTARAGACGFQGGGPLAASRIVLLPGEVAVGVSTCFACWFDPTNPSKGLRTKGFQCMGPEQWQGGFRHKGGDFRARVEARRERR